jgi:sugar transferase (PEP-CTERM/EpsH1 system associated)
MPRRLRLRALTPGACKTKPVTHSADTAVVNDTRPLVLHVVSRFDTGGLENGVVNLINHMPTTAYRHAVLALHDITSFKERVRAPGVGFYALHKTPGHGFKLYPRMWRLTRELKPAVVHTRNLGPLEMQVAVAAAGGARRVHGEHGRELNDLDGSNIKLQRVRRLYAPFVHRYVALSRDLQDYLIRRVGINADRISQIYNGVDAERFRPSGAHNQPVVGCPFAAPAHWLIGTVGRMQGVKDQVLLARAFVLALQQQPALRQSWRLVMVGDGPLREQALQVLAGAGVADLAWLPGERRDVPEIMQSLSCFVLPSLAEGISNTILEAMACGLPVVATAVGGNAELVAAGRTGEVVPAADAKAMADALLRMSQGSRAQEMGGEGRREVERRFSMQAMVGAYQSLYDHELATAGQTRLAT